MRSVATSLLLFFTLVLPMAGVQKRFCTSAFHFLADGASCEVCPSGADCDGTAPPADPDSPCCLTAAKFLPDGIQPTVLDFSPLLAIRTHSPFEKSVIHPPLETRLHKAANDRAPPGPLPLFLLHQSLVI